MATTEHPLAAAYDALTRRCGLVDRSERGKLLLTGPEAKEFLHGQVTNEIEGLEPGSGCYAAFLTHKGKMLGDMRVLDGGDAGLWLDCERGALQELFNMIRRYKLGRQAELHKRTLERALFSLIGPDARRVAGADGLPETEHAHGLATVGGARVRLVVTDLGIDVIADAEDAEAVRQALVAAGAEPVGDDAAEVVRVESGRPRFGIDLEPDAVIPQEAGLNARAVSFEKGCYVGQETVARLHWRGKPNRHLRGLRLSEPVPAGTELTTAEGKVVGRVTSPLVSPARGPLALALVRREVAPGDTVRAGDGATADVVELPFPSL
jgi:folate-binding protein YgfZ